VKPPQPSHRTRRKIHLVRLSPAAQPPDIHQLNYRAANPYHTWLNTLCAGAAFACLAFVIDAALSFAWLSARMQGVPRQPTMRFVYPFALLGIAAFRWVAVWLLTTEDPSPHPTRRIRAWSLRLLVTASLLIVFLYVLRFLDEWRFRTSNVMLALYTIELLTTILFWMHLRWVGAKFDLRGSRWRAIVAMVGMSATLALLYIAPRAWPTLRQNLGVSAFQWQNARWSMTVLWAVVSALVALRFALGFANEVRQDVKSTASATTVR
jgi:hypothetical protein